MAQIRILEQQFQAKVIKLLQDRGAYVVKTIAATKAGVPDIIACYRGLFIGIECKAGSKVTPLQKYNLQQINQKGGVAMVMQPVYHKDEDYMPNNIEALAEFLDEIDLKMAATNVVEDSPHDFEDDNKPEKG